MRPALINSPEWEKVHHPRFIALKGEYMDATSFPKAYNDGLGLPKLNGVR